MSTPGELWDRLAAANLVSGTMPAREVTSSPWYVNAMVGIAAWVASIFLLFFLGIALASLVREPEGAIAVGLVVCVACAATLRFAWRNLFVSQTAVAMSLAGQALLLYGVLENQWRNPGAWAAVAAIEVALVAGAPNYVHRVLSTLAAVYAVRFALLFAGLVAWFPALVATAFVFAQYLADRGVPHEGIWRPVVAGLALGALLVIPVSLTDMLLIAGRNPASQTAAAWSSAVALAAVLLVAIGLILRDARVAWSSRTAIAAFAAGAAVALAARPVAGVVVALIVLLVAFAAGRRALAGLAVVGILLGLSHYYYAMETTLLAKSAALFAAGIVLAVAGLAVRLGIAASEARHA